MSTSLKTLITKLNGTARLATERAANLCLSHGHYEVDLEHLFLALLEQADNDLARILQASRISPTAMQADLEREIRTFKNGNTRTPVFSQHMQQLFQQAWLLASLDAQSAQIRTGHLLLALLTAPDLAQLALRGSSLFAKIRLDELKHDFDHLTEGSAEADRATATGGTVPDVPGPTAERADSASPAKTPALDQFTTDLTQRARDGGLDPVIGRDAEIRQVIDILTRRRQNNPILTGEAGVGKTAVVEGLALRIAAQDVPASLRGVTLRTLDMGLLQAGASVKGEFENRLKNVIAEIKSSLNPIVLFVDEAHTMIGAGGQAGQGDAANLLKPALARGELRTIAATTWGEYKKYFEKDAALARRFQVVKVEEPGETLAAAMLRGMVPLMERHFGIRVLDEAVTEAVRLSHRYISGRQLPDKAVSVLDTACAKVALGRSATPALIEEAERSLERIEAEAAALVRDTAAGGRHAARQTELSEQKAALQTSLAGHRQRLAEEGALVERIHALRAQRDEAATRSGSGQEDSLPSRRAGRAKAAAGVDAGHDELDRLLAELRVLQGTAPLVPLQVDGHVIAEIVSAWTGVPLGRMVKDEIKVVRSLDTLLGERVIGQDHALAAVAQRVRTANARLEDPHKPRGVFLFVGPSGVGKTETALALADILYGGEKKLITINMSEYQEAHSVSGLKGSPPGYVGYGEGGVLTEAVRRQPYSVVLLDEVEKAHPDVLEMFFQVFDKGMMDDAEGREIDFRNTLIILTSNIGSAQIMQACLNKADEERPAPDALGEALRPVLVKAFKPAFLGRLKVVPFYPITDAVLEQIITLKLGRIRERIAAHHKAAFEWDVALVEAVLARCTEVDSGARNVDHILNATLLPELAEAVLARMADEAPFSRIKAGCAKNGEFRYRIA